MEEKYSKDSHRLIECESKTNTGGSLCGLQEKSPQTDDNQYYEPIWKRNNTNPRLYKSLKPQSGNNCSSFRNCGDVNRLETNLRLTANHDDDLRERKSEMIVLDVDAWKRKILNNIRKPRKPKNSSADNDENYEPKWRKNSTPRQYKRSKPKERNFLQIEDAVGKTSRCFLFDEKNKYRVQNNIAPLPSNTVIDISFTDHGFMSHSVATLDLPSIPSDSASLSVNMEAEPLSELRESNFSFNVVEECIQVEENVTVTDVQACSAYLLWEKDIMLEDSSFENTKNFLETFKQNADDKYVCIKCNRTFKPLTSNYRLEKHMKIYCKGSKKQENSENKVLCVWCETKFKSKGELKAHTLVGCYPIPTPTESTAPKESRSGTCGDCGKFFLHLDRHRHTCGICELCGKFYTNVDRHRQSHRELKCFKCRECGKGFKSSSNLHTHVAVVHRKRKPWFYCSRCPVRNRSKKHVIAHEKTHDLPEGAEIPKPFQCPCGKAFISQHMLSIHKNFNHKQRKCHLCGEVCGTLYLVQKHKRLVHNIGRSTKEKDKLSCPVCRETLVGVQALSDHLTAAHEFGKAGPGRPLRCDLCPKTYYLFGTYVWHKTSYHKKEVTESELRAMAELVSSTIENAKPGTIIKIYQQ